MKLVLYQTNFMQAFMREAIALAKSAEGFTHPNPLVGAVIVKDGAIIAKGFHKKYGDLHAEREALRDAAERNVDVRGAEMFVTLEPCCHFGKQPPCTDAIIQSGIKKVYIGSRDSNPLVNGKGVQILRDAGLEVVQDFLRDECDALNDVFFHFIKTKMPYVILKYAVTADGLTATCSAKSKWITGEKARKKVHEMRANVSAVMTGINTVLSDDPMLNVRLEDKKPHHQGARIVIDKEVKLPCESALAKTAFQIPVIDVCSETLSEKSLEQKHLLKKMGVIFLQCPLTKDGHLDLQCALKKLGEQNIDSILVESGGALNAAFLFSQGAPLAQEVNVFIAPKIFGTTGGTIFSPVRGLGVSEVSDAILLSTPQIEIFDDDVLLKYKIKQKAI